MQVKQNVLLSDYTTMRIGGPARFMIDVHDLDELEKTIKRAKSENLPIFILGGGSNVIASDKGFYGLVIRIRIPGFEIISEDENSATIKVGAGENWDEFVRRTVDKQLSGVEALSQIPGTVGATPVQNVGAYGQEVADTIVSIDAYDMQKDCAVTIPSEECMFGYRDSIFRSTRKGRYIIYSVTFKLKKEMPKPPFYEAIQKYFDENNITNYTPVVIRDAVTKIRTDKLPDPSIYANSGSFFKNAIVDDWKVNELKIEYPDMPNYPAGHRTLKIPTGWLIEKTGLKGLLINGMRIHDKNALVLINESARDYNDLSSAKDKIISKVRDKFGINIEQEPIEIPTS